MEIKYIQKQKPRIEIDAKDFNEFLTIARNYHLECNAYMYCKETGKNMYKVYDLFYPKQTNTDVQTNTDADDFMDMVNEYNLDKSKLCGHIHSHVNMPVFASGGDEKSIEDRSFLKDFEVALILNKKGEVYGHIVDNRKGVHFFDVDVFVNYKHNTSELEAYILDKVKKSDCIKDVQKLLKMNDDDYYNLTNNVDEEYVKKIIKEKFKKAVDKTHVSNNNVKNNKENITERYPGWCDNQFNDLEQNAFGDVHFYYEPHEIAAAKSVLRGETVLTDYDGYTSGIIEEIFSNYINELYD